MTRGEQHVEPLVLSCIKDEGTARIGCSMLPFLSSAAFSHLWPRWGPGGIPLFSLGLSLQPRAEPFTLTCYEA